MKQTQMQSYLQLTVGINEQVSGLQVTVQHVGRVDVLESTQNLIQKVLEVGVGERLLRADNLVHVSLHEFLHHINLFKIVAWRLHDVQNVDNLTRARWMQITTIFDMVIICGWLETTTNRQQKI